MKNLLLSLAAMAVLGLSVQAETLSVEFSPKNESEVLEGNLIVLISNKKFSASGPGLLNVYGSRIESVKNIRWEAGERLDIDLGQLDLSKDLYLYANFDENQNFMWRGFPDAGEYHAQRLHWKSGDSKTLVLDQTRKVKEPKELDWLTCLLYTSPSPRDQRGSRMPSSA